MQHKRTLAYLNHFVTRTASFLNHFAAVCEEARVPACPPPVRRHCAAIVGRDAHPAAMLQKLQDIQFRLQRLEITARILETKVGRQSVVGAGR